MRSARYRISNRVPQVHKSIRFRKQQVLDDILRFSAKVSKMRLKAQVKRRNDFCITAANPQATGSAHGEHTVLDLKDIFEKRAPALTVTGEPFVPQVQFP